MSAHRIYCYAPQRGIVEDFLKSVGAVISRDCPHVVHDREQLMGLEHITFATVDNHPNPIPQPMWEHLTAHGAMVIHIDDQYARARRAPHIKIHHYGADSAESPRAAVD